MNEDDDYERDLKRYDEALNRINRMSAISAKESVDVLLRDPLRFVVSPSRGRHLDLVSRLGPMAIELFSSFDSITTADGGASLGPAYFHAFLRYDLIIVGGTEDVGPIAVPLNSDEVIVVSDLGYSRLEIWLRSIKHGFLRRRQWLPRRELYAPTVYHTVLILDLDNADD
jgi:hypothetical protein